MVYCYLHCLITNSNFTWTWYIIFIQREVVFYWHFSCCYYGGYQCIHLVDCNSILMESHIYSSDQMIKERNTHIPSIMLFHSSWYSICTMHLPSSNTGDWWLDVDHFPKIASMIITPFEEAVLEVVSFSLQVFLCYLNLWIKINAYVKSILAYFVRN